MSDFLANFDKKNYKKTLDERKDKEEKIPVKPASKQKEEVLPSRKDFQRDPEEYVADETDRIISESRRLVAEAAAREAAAESEPTATEAERFTPPAFAGDAEAAEDEYLPSRASRSGEEETEVDPTYKKRKQKKIMLISIASVIAAIVLFVVYYSMTHVKMPNFNEKPVAEAREWAAENKIKIDLEQEYDFEHEVNTITKQNIKAGKQVKKKGEVKLTASLGPDPEEVIPLPDFAKLTKAKAEDWVKEHKAENFSVLEEYSDTVEKGLFVRQEITNKEVTPETYKRQDQGIVYYSKGKEVFEKNIDMPDFNGKQKSDVEAWVKTNEIKMEYKNVDSDKVAPGLVVSQSVEKGKKIAKRDSMSVSISTGPAVIIPDFADYNPENATEAPGLTVTVKTVFSAEAAYGQLMSQSIEAGKKVSVKEGEQQKITVTYSAGRPYLRSYFGDLEGDLDKKFYDDYRSKGAHIYFNTYYIDSAETKGTVVKMDTYNQYVPLEYTVNIGISNGSGAGTPTHSPSQPSAPESDPDPVSTENSEPEE